MFGNTAINALNEEQFETVKMPSELVHRLCLAKQFIQKNLTEKLDIDMVAEVACLSKYHFIRTFKRLHGATPRQYLIQCRLQRAQWLLRHSELSFAEICLEVGLEDPGSFGKMFKRTYGISPGRFRRKVSELSDC